MKIYQLLEIRQAQWRELELICHELESKSLRRMTGQQLSRFATLYRAACADLALADAYQLPPSTIHYLHNLVGRSHNQFYRASGFDLSRLTQLIFRDLPRQLFFDSYLRTSIALFWGTFLFAMHFTMQNPDYAHTICGEEQIAQLEQMYSGSLDRGGLGSDAAMSGFYIFHNTGIGLQCFAYGLLGGVGGLFAIVYNAMMIGSMFGYMTSVPQGRNFFEFVTAHGPCELTAIVLSGAAGMRLGFALFFTRGQTRRSSLKQAGKQALPVMGAAAALFFMAAFIEGFISGSVIPREIKACIAAITSGAIMFYFVLLGLPELNREN